MSKQRHVYYWKDLGTAIFFFFFYEIKGKVPNETEWDIGGQYMYIERRSTQVPG